jgi:hypothetical protein
MFIMLLGVPLIMFEGADSIIPEFIIIPGIGTGGATGCVVRQQILAFWLNSVSLLPLQLVKSPAAKITASLFALVDEFYFF